MRLKSRITITSYCSTYPTKDKKYECRTGPLEDFFVSSVEFCQYVKFDDKDRKDNRDNRTGTQGERGLTGMTLHQVRMRWMEHQD